jgi:hypothetical protein
MTNITCPSCTGNGCDHCDESGEVENYIYYFELDDEECDDDEAW